MIKAANRPLAQASIEPISERVSPHSLSRTSASLRVAVGDDPVYIAEQLGHEDPGFTFRGYQRAAEHCEKLSGIYLEAFDRALDWAALGSGSLLEGVAGTEGPDRGGGRIPHRQAIIGTTGR